MSRSAQTRRTLLVLVVAGALSAYGQSKPSPTPDASKSGSSATVPHRHPDLRVDDPDPDRTPSERPGQGMTGELPLDTSHVEVPPDSSQPMGKPDAGGSRVSSGQTPAISAGTAISFRLTTALSSATQHNGDAVHGTLAAPLRTHDGKDLPAGTPVVGTVVSVARAGAIQSGGVLSIELTAIANVPVVSDIQIFNGQPGHKDLADSAPEKGSEAQVAAGTLLHFQETI